MQNETPAEVSTGQVRALTEHFFTCPSGNANFETTTEKQKDGVVVKIYKCTSCGHVIQT